MWSGVGGVGVGAHDAEFFGEGGDASAGGGDGFVLLVSVEVDEEHVVAVASGSGSGFESGEVDAVPEEFEEDADEGAGLVGGGEEDGGAVVSGGRVVVVGDDDEAGAVVWVVFDAGLCDEAAGELCGASWGDGGGAGAVLDGGARGFDGGGGGFGASVGEVSGEVSLALVEGLRVGVDDVDVCGVGVGVEDEAVFDGDDDVAADAGEVVVEEEVVGFADAAADGVFVGEDGAVGVALLLGLSGGGDGGEGEQLCVGCGEEGGLFGEGAVGSEEGDAELFWAGHGWSSALVRRERREFSKWGWVTARTISPAWRRESGWGSSGSPLGWRRRERMVLGGRPSCLTVRPATVAWGG